MVDETERQAAPTSPSLVRPNGCTGVLVPAVNSSPHKKVFLSIAKPSPRVHPYEGLPKLENNGSHRKHCLATLVYRKPFSLLYAFSKQRQLTSSTCYRANGQHMIVRQRNPTQQNTLSLILNHPNNRHRKWIFCRGVCVGLHQFPPRVLTLQVRVSALIKLLVRVLLLYARPASEQLRGTSLVIR